MWQSTSASTPVGSASIVILPVVRVERHVDDMAGYHPDAHLPGGGSRHRRS